MNADAQPRTPKLRLLHVIASADPRGGGPIEGILRQDEAVAEIGHREIVSLDPPDAPFLKDHGIRVHPLGIGRFDPRTLGNRFLRFGYTPKLAPWLRKHSRDYDCVIVNGLWSYASVGASRVLPDLRVPYFVFTHGMLDPWFRRQYPLKHAAKQAFWLAFEGRLLHHARAVLFTSEEERLLARGEFWGYSYREQVVGYGAGDVKGDPGQQINAFRTSLPRLGAKPYLLFLSRIHHKKGCDLLIRAFARIAAQRPNLDLVIAGPDQSGWRSKLEAIARELKIDGRVHWPGMLTGDAKWGAFRAAEAFVLPSHQENFGIVVAEALACGAPVLITDKVNIWREVEAAGAGLVAADDQDGVNCLIEQFLTLEPEARDRMRRAARACFETHFDMGVSAHALLRLVAGLK